MGRKFFPHLHIHDEHSIKDGCSTVEAYGDIAKDLGGDCLAITNHGQASGFARQYFACRDRGLKPIFGMEAYINEYRERPIKRLQEELTKADKATAKHPEQNAHVKAKLGALRLFIAERFRPSPHAIILAKNRAGYRNLVRMSTDSFERGFYYVPRTDTKFLADHREGLVYSTACIGGYIPRMARENFDLACEEAKRLQAIFDNGGGGFFVELMITEYPAQRETNEVMIRLASRINAPCIITCDVHYARPEDGEAQNVLLLMRDKKTIADKEAGEGVWQFEAKDLWWRTIQDVARCWKDYHSDYMDRECFQQALRNTLALADEIEDIEFDTGLKLPGVFSEPEHNLREAVKRGLRYRKDRGQLAPGVRLFEYVDRARRELEVINQKGFAEYFLILADVCGHARVIGACMGPGRGSAGGSLIAYLTQITEIDPLRFNLLFERFLDASRSDPPDIDLDFSPEHRDGVKSYVERTYPATATIGSNATFKPRATLQDVGRVFGIDYREMQAVTKPLGNDADDMTWEQILETWPAIRRFVDDHPEAWGVVRTLRGLISHRGKNAAGMLIAPASALDEIPMMIDKGQIVTAFADSQGDGVDYKGRELTRLGYLKADFLGVRNLNIAPHAVGIVARDTGQVIDLENLPLDDPETLAVASTGDVPGTFQLDTSTTRPIMRHVGVDSFGDLVMITALARPGPLKHQVHRDYARLKQDDSWLDEVPEGLSKLLEDSRGLMILQEDVMWVVQVMCGMTKIEANALRKITSKKHPEAMALWKDKFMGGGRATGLVDEESLAELWSKIETFAGFGFCKSICHDQKITIRRACGTANQRSQHAEQEGEQEPPEGVRDGQAGGALPQGEREESPHSVGEEEEAREEIAVAARDVVPGDLVRAQDGEWVRVVAVHDHGLQYCVNLRLPAGGVVCTMDHRFPTDQGVKTLRDILRSGAGILTDQGYQRVTNIWSAGPRQTLDLEIDHPTHCYFLTNGVCTHNSHAVAYMLTAYRQLYMLTHHTVEYFAALLTHTPRAKKNSAGDELYIDYMRAAMARRITVLGPCVLEGAVGFDVTKYGHIRFGLGHIKGVGSAGELVIAARPFASLEELFTRVAKGRVNARVFQQLIFSGALDALDFDRHAGRGDPIPDLQGIERRNGIMLRYQQLRGSKDEVPAYSLTVLREKEREALGIPLSWWSSETIKALRRDEGLESIDYHKRQDRSKLEVLVEVTRVKTHRTKKGGTMAFLGLADETGVLRNVTIWPEQWKAHKRALASGRMVILRLRRRENNDPSFGQWAYYLEDRYSEAVESVARALRKDRSDEDGGQ